MNTINDEERHTMEELLPWYAAGTLSRGEMRRVEDAIAHDPALARKYETILEELAGTVELNESLGAPSSRAMEKLFANIDAEPARRSVSKAGLAERLSLFLASLSPRKLAWAASAIALVLVLQTGLIGSFLINPRAVYELASGQTTRAPEGAFALVRFVPEASATDITRLLEAHNVAILGGPYPGDLYRIGAATAGLPEEERARLIEQLRQDGAVSFVAPSE
jgi:anti-sigma factor RsiW